MNEYFCDHGAYGLTSNRLGLDVPAAWGVPQEGDGSTKDASTASSVASITFAAGPTSGVLSVCGVSISTTGVLGTTAAAAATALAANINANGTAVSSAVATGTPFLNNLVYARAVGARLDIMMRIGSTKLNYAVNANCGVASTFDGSPTLVQFTGGLGGCWGIFWVNTAYGVSGNIGQRQYGLFVKRPYVIYRADPVIDDFIYIRTGGANKTISINNPDASYAGEVYGSGTNATLMAHYVFDTNTKWTGDGTTGQLVLDMNVSAYNSFMRFSWNQATAAQPFALTALRRGGFKFKCTTSGTSSGAFTFTYSGGASVLTNILFQDDSPTSCLPAIWQTRDDYNNQHISWINCDFVASQPRNYIATIAQPYGQTESCVLNWINCTFTWNTTGITDPGPLLSLQYQNNYDMYVMFQNCTFSGFAAGYSPYAAAFPFGGGIKDFVFDNCTGLKIASNYWGIPSGDPNGKSGGPADYMRFFWNGGGVNGAYRYENLRGVTEWLPNDATPFPTLSALLLDGATPWSLRFIWLVSGIVTRSNYVNLPSFKTMNRLATSVKTISLDIFVQSGIVFTDTGWIATVSYTDNTGAQRTEMLPLPVASGAAWANSGSYSSHVAKKMSLVTSYQVAANSIVSVEVRISMPPTTGARSDIYFNPDVTIAN